MKFRIVIEKDSTGMDLGCPYVVCGHCDDVIRPGDAARVVRPHSERIGDTEAIVLHDRCEWPNPKGLDRPLGDWLRQALNNSVGM